MKHQNLSSFGVSANISNHDCIKGACVCLDSKPRDLTFLFTSPRLPHVHNVSPFLGFLSFRLLLSNCGKHTQLNTLSNYATN